MDPITLVVYTIASGLAAGLADASKAAVKDAYEEFKARLRKKVEGHEDAEKALVLLEKKPDSESRQSVLKEELAGLGIENDGELIKLGQVIMEKLDKKGAKADKYTIDIKDSQGIVIGPHAKVEQYFGSKPK